MGGVGLLVSLFSLILNQCGHFQSTAAVVELCSGAFSETKSKMSTSAGYSSSVGAAKGSVYEP